LSLEEVSTTRGSGWVRSRVAPLNLLLDQRCEQFCTENITASGYAPTRYRGWYWPLPTMILDF